MSLAAPFLTGCTLLLLAGVMKAARPGDTARALSLLVPGLPLGVATMAVRVLAAGEAALGTAAVVLPIRPLVGAVAGSYLAFALVVSYARLRGGPLASCGCFGTPDTPATWLHVAVDALLAGAASAAAAAGPRPAPWGELVGQPLHAAPLLLVGLAGAWLVFLVLGPAARLGVVAAEVRAQSGSVERAPAVPLPDPARRGPQEAVR